MLSVAHHLHEFGGSKMQRIFGVAVSSAPTQICQRMSREALRRSFGPTKTVRPSTVVIHSPLTAR